MPRPKIEVPRLPANSLARDRLTHLLSAADGDGGPDAAASARRIVDVCAPAGYGKTTLLAAHAAALRARGLPAAWVTCDRHDNAPIQLWSAILTSMSSALRRSGADGADDRFADMRPPQHEMEPAFLAEFVEAVDALPTPIALILDDAHELVSPAVLGGADELLRNLPTQLHLLLGCRFDPPLTLPRLRLAGRVHDVRAGDLAFTVDEARTLLEAQQVPVPDDTVTLLVERTEGWPAALRLAALSLVDEPDPATFVKTFAGDQRGVADYLVAEVLTRQPPDLRDFLVTTSVVEELTVDLAVALSGRADAGAILNRLERANALVTRIGPDRRWYRYHSLLRSFLLAELRGRDPSAARTLHAVASDWFAGAQLPELALDHAVAAGDDVGVVGLLRRFALGQLLSGAGAMVRHVLASISADAARSTEASLIGVIAALEEGDLPEAERLLRSAGTDGPGDDAWLVRLRYAADLYLARMRGDVSILEDGRVTDPAGGDDDDDVELLVLVNRAALRIAAGDYRDARGDVVRALTIARRSRRDYLALQCMNQLSAIAGALSELPATKAAAEEAISFATERGWASSPRMAYAYTLAAWAAYQSLDLRTAARWGSTAVGVLHGTMTPEVEGAARFAEAVIAFDRPPDRRDALQRLRRTWTTLGSVSPSPALAAYAGMAELHMCLALGEAGWARTAVHRIERLLGPDGDAAAMQAVLLLRQRQAAQARRLLAALLADEARTVVTSNHVTAWLVEALAAADAGEPHAAHSAVTAALALAEPSAVLRPFYDLGHPVRELLIGSAGRMGDLDPLVTRLLDAWSSADGWQHDHAGHADRGEQGRIGRRRPPLQPLTVRELEILRDLPSMLTTEEIAEAHVVSINTIKTHLKSIYRKLGVNSRREAVEAGRLTGIL